MNAPASERMSAAKAGWVLVMLMAAWAAFLVLPFGREKKSESRKEPVERPGEAELAAVGLRYNVDWIGMPEIFTVWADQAHWYEEKVRFAYWDASSREYDYFFEATRRGKQVHFRAMSREEASKYCASFSGQVEVPDRVSYVRERLLPDAEITEDERAKQYPAHPFVFFPLLGFSGIYPNRTIVEVPKTTSTPDSSVPIDLKVERMEVLSPHSLPKSDDQPKK